MRFRGFRSRALSIVVLVALLVLVMPVSAFSTPVTAQTYWVDAVDGSDGYPGTEAEPFETITHALSVSGPSDTLMVEPGTYDAANGETFPLAVYGETLISTAGMDVTFLVGDGADSVIGAQGLSDGDVIRGFTITGGRVDAGAGLNLYLSNPTSPGWPLIEENTFEGNSSDYGGGAISLFTGSPIDVSPSIRYNTFLHNTSQEGGAIRLSGTIDATFEHNTFDSNAAPLGGAISAATEDSTLTVVGNEFISNEATSGVGGAIRVSHTGGQEHLIQDNLFMENAASGDGGALWLFGCNVLITGSSGGGNDAGGSADGGFAWLQHVTATAENNVIGGCSAGDQGAVWYLDEAALYENNDTVVDAFAADDATHAQTGDTLEITNSIYWNQNVDADIVNADALAYSCVYDALVADGSRNNVVGSGVIGDDPMFIDPPGHDARLGLGSPCVDTGDAATAADADFFGTSRPQDGDGDTVAAPDMGYFEKPALEVSELSGADRYKTAVEIARETFESSDFAVVASGQNFPDALSAAGLAGSYECPLVLTKTSSLPADVSTLLSDLGVTDVFVVGGEAAVSTAVFDALDADYDAERIWGSTRYATAAMVAEEIAANEGSSFRQGAFIARGDSFPDALSLSPMSYANAIPILLTKPGSLPASTTAVLSSLDIEHAAIAGGTSAVSATTKDAIDSVLVANGGSASDRWSGSDRYATAVEVAEKGVDAHFATWDMIGISTGENYPDALAGGARVGAYAGVVLLTKTNSLPGATATALGDHADAVLYVDVFGGTVAVSDTVRTAVMDELGW